MALRENGLSRDVVNFKYSPQAGILTYHFLWAVPPKAEQDVSTYLRLAHEISDSIPKFHTRLMRHEFKEHFSSLVKVNASVMNEMYRFLTGDEAVPGKKNIERS